MSAIAISRSIGPVALDVIIREGHTNRLEITEHAVEAGAEITDHAYTKQKLLTLEVADAEATDTWQSLKRLQESREPFDIITGLDRYSSMLISEMSAERDRENSNILKGKVELREIIIVDTASSGTGGMDARGGGSNPSGKNSRRSGGVSPARSGDSATAARASGVTARGDSATAPVTPAKKQSVLKGLLG